MRAAAPGWPATLSGRLSDGGAVRLRPLARHDAETYIRLRIDNAEWLQPWEATTPTGARPRTYAAMRRSLATEAKAGRALPFAVDVDGELSGQVIGSVQRGSFLSCSVGYWVAERVAGRGVAPLAVALVGDHALGPAGLHRLEADIRPENTASLAVARKLGLRDEGTRPRLLHIDGAWRDHRCFAVTAEEIGPGGLLGRLNHQ